MNSVLMMTSEVAFGQVGFSAAAAPCHHLGLEVVGLPTVLLSNHPGPPRFARTPIAPSSLEDMISALASNDWLKEFQTLFTGYLPTEGHVVHAARSAASMRKLTPNLLYVCDPILGDDPGGLYIDVAAADKTKQTLIPSADLIVPNRFELSWLADREVRSIDDAIAAARSLPTPWICATSIPDGPSHLANVFVGPDSAFVARVKRRPHAPHGTGDLFAGSLTAQLALGNDAAAALTRAAGTVEHALDVSATSDRLLLPLMDWAHGIKAIEVDRLE
jgi:pyridoxine kinase